MAIGRVSVEVTPDARGFVEKMRGEILPGADKLGRDIGAKIGDQAGRTARSRINAQLKDIKAKVNVNADTAKAQAQIAALREETKATGDEAKKAGSHYGLLLKILLAIGPALIPLGAAAAVGLGALVEGAGVALLILNGIKQNIKDNTLLGRAYKGVLGELKGEFRALSDVAARGAFGSTSKIVDDIRQHMPELVAQTKLFSGYLGQAAFNVADSLLGGFKILQPLIAHILSGIVNLTARFDAWVHGGGLDDFVKEMTKELPVISQALGDIFSAIGKLLVAGNSIGLIYLNAFAIIARVINKLPIGVLTDLLALLIALKLATLAWGSVSTAVNAITASTKAAAVQIAVFSGVQREAAVANLGFAASAGVVSATLLRAIPIIGAFFAAFEGGKLLDKQAQKPGIFGTIANALVSTPGLGPKHGPSGGSSEKKSQQTQLDALASNYNALTDAQLKQAATQEKTNAAMTIGVHAADNLATAINNLNDQFLNVASSDTNFWQSLQTTTETLKTNKAAIEGHSKAALADQSALQAVVNAAEQQAEATGKATHNEVIGIAKLRDSKLALEAKLRSQGLLTAAIQRYIDKIFKIPKGAETVPHFKSEAAENRLLAYLAKIHYVPARKTTTFDARTGTAVTKIGNLLTLYNALTNKTVTVTVFGSADTGLKGPGHAYGGWVGGHGGPRADDQLIPASTGEFVVPAPQAAANAAYLNSLAPQGYKTGGSVQPPKAAPTTINVYEAVDPTATAYAVQRRLAFSGRV